MLATTSVVPIHGCTNYMMFYLAEKNKITPEVSHICKTRTTSHRGRWNVLTDITNFNEVKNKLAILLEQVLQNDIPKDALMSVSKNSPLLQTQPNKLWNDNSSGEESYISIFKRSRGSNVSNLTGNDDNYIYPPLSIQESISWADMNSNHITRDGTTIISPLTSKVKKSAEEDIIQNFSSINKSLTQQVENLTTQNKRMGENFQNNTRK